MGGAVDPADMEAPPTCTCHNEPMAKHGSDPGYRCSVKQREYRRRYDRAHPRRAHDRYRRLIDEGLCGICGKHPLCTGSRCFDCAGKLDETNLNRIF